MASVPIAPSPPAPSTEELERNFRQLEADWTSGTAHLSSTTKILGHPALRQIVAMGPAVVPLILRDLRREPALWVLVLPELTGVDPVPPADRGNIAKMTEAWLRWAGEHGLQK